MTLEEFITLGLEAMKGISWELGLKKSEGDHISYLIGQLMQEGTKLEVSCYLP
jgi:hypothetical protein